MKFTKLIEHLAPIIQFWNNPIEMQGMLNFFCTNTRSDIYALMAWRSEKG